MNVLLIVFLQSAFQQQKSSNLEINEIFDQLRSGFQPNQSTQYLTPNEVASLFHVDIRTIRKWACKGKLKAYRYGHRVFYKRHELLKVITY